MTREELIKKSVFQSNDNELFAQYLIPSEFCPLEEKDICGCWLLVFNSKEQMKSWAFIYESFKKVVHSNTELREMVDFEEIYRIDERSLCLNRGFNEAYTTSKYAEYLAYGDCTPDEDIVEHLDALKKALDQPYDFHFVSEMHKKVMDGLIKKAFVDPNSELKWTDEPFPWTLYIPPISMEDLKNEEN